MSLTTQFLTSIRGLLRQQDGASLRAWLRVDADAPAQYFQLAQELRTGFRGDAAVARLVEKCLPLDDGDGGGGGGGGGGAPWPSFVAFVRDYLLFWRDVDFGDLPALYAALSGLLTACGTAFSHPTHGAVLLDTSVAVSETLARLVMVLHRRPDLMRSARVQSSGSGSGRGRGAVPAAAGGGGGGGDDERKSLVESTADAIQKLCTTCLTDRSSARFARPAGRKVAVYRLANLVLRLLFAGDKARWAAQMFTNITATGPPLAFYPAAQRVTYLYYLGRFYLENNHYARAAACLEAAYRQTPPACRRHRRLLLTHLVPAKLLLGVLPTPALLLRPEAADELRPVFAPLAAAVRHGHFAAFQAALRQHEAWLVRHRLLLTLTYRLRPFLWRSLARRTFLLTYAPPLAAAPASATASSTTTTTSGGGGRAAPTLDLADLLAVATLAQHQIEGYTPAAPAQRPRPPHTNTLFLREAPAGGDGVAPLSTTLVPPPGGPRRLRPSEGLVWGNLAVTLADVESVVAALAAQGLMHGFVAHAAAKFAVVGAKAKGSAVRAGWPPVAQVLRERLQENGVDASSVPAWVQAP